MTWFQVSERFWSKREDIVQLHIESEHVLDDKKKVFEQWTVAGFTSMGQRIPYPLFTATSEEGCKEWIKKFANEEMISGAVDSE